MVESRKVGALPRTPPRADGPWNPRIGWVNGRGQLGPFDRLGRPLPFTHPLSGSKGASPPLRVQGRALAFLEVYS